ncbi:hypothetical protein J4Q44_G00041160, partial [Coregonus suidteri]
MGERKMFCLVTFSKEQLVAVLYYTGLSPEGPGQWCLDPVTPCLLLWTLREVRRTRSVKSWIQGFSRTSSTGRGTAQRSGAWFLRVRGGVDVTPRSSFGLHPFCIYSIYVFVLGGVNVTPNTYKPVFKSLY